jgi:hypothetical protein
MHANAVAATFKDFDSRTLEFGLRTPVAKEEAVEVNVSPICMASLHSADLQ